MVKKMYGTKPLRLERTADICKLHVRSTKLIFVGYGQLNSTTDVSFSCWFNVMMTSQSGVPFFLLIKGLKIEYYEFQLA